MVVNFESVWDNLDFVLDYIGCKNYKSNFPKYRERKSENLLNELQENKLSMIYKDMNKQLNNFPKIFIKNENSVN